MGRWRRRSVRVVWATAERFVIRAGGRLTVTNDPWLLDRGIEDASPERVVLDAEQAVADQQRLRHVWSAFRRLPERCQQLLRMLVAAPRPSYSNIAEMLGIPIGSIGPTRARCLDRLRALLVEPTLSNEPSHP